MENEPEKTVMQEPTEIVAREKEVFVVPELSETEMQRLEGSVVKWERLVQVAVRLTRPHNWTNQNGHPYLDAGGAEAVKNPFGIDIRNIMSERMNRTDEKGEYYIWTYTGQSTCKLTGITLDVEGVCSSRADLFGKVGNEYRHIEDIDESDIMITARHKLLRNAVVEHLGMRALTWEDLAQGNIKESAVKTIERQSKTQKDDRPLGEQSLNFGKHKGIPFEKLIQDPEGREYLEWLSKQNYPSAKVAERVLKELKASPTADIGKPEDDFRKQISSMVAQVKDSNEYENLLATWQVESPMDIPQGHRSAFIGDLKKLAQKFGRK